MEDAEWTRWLAEPVRGRKVILAYRVLAGMTPLVDALRTWGAQRPLLVSVGRGTGPLPPVDTYDLVTLDEPPPDTMTEEVRRAAALAAEPPAKVIAAVEAYDPNREAVWWLTPFGSNAPQLGRQVLGGRPDQWAALEDKTLCDELWEEAGIAYAPSRTVPAVVADLDAAARELDGGRGTVWSGDAREGLNGGSDYVRWVRTPDHADHACAFFAAHCDRVRVMPYLDGTSCSIHGFVLPDGVAALRPVELVQLPEPDSGTFESGGMSTWWDPPSRVRDSMRAAARAVGRVLDRRVGYRGGFSIDGVVTEEGFLPTELNPRFSGGLTTLARAVPELPIELVQLNAMLGRDIRMSAAELEDRIVSAADEDRGGRVMALVPAVAPTDSVEHVVDWVDGELRPGNDSTSDAVVRLGPSMVGGGFAMWELDERVIGRGESARTHAAALRRFAELRF